jgi:hypothetical protein
MSNSRNCSWFFQKNNIKIKMTDSQKNIFKSLSDSIICHGDEDNTIFCTGKIGDRINYPLITDARNIDKIFCNNKEQISLLLTVNLKAFPCVHFYKGKKKLINPEITYDSTQLCGLMLRLGSSILAESGMAILNVDSAECPKGQFWVQLIKIERIFKYLSKRKI